jgi:hypothetical protein
MNAIKIKREELLAIVRENLQKHIKEFEESVVDYRALVLQIAAHNLKVAKTGDVSEFRKMKAHPSAPTSYEDSYKRAIRMLELSVDDIIEVEEDIFNQLVMDEWNWKRSFTATTMSYKAGF